MEILRLNPISITLDIQPSQVKLIHFWAPSSFPPSHISPETFGPRGSTIPYRWKSNIPWMVTGMINKPRSCPFPNRSADPYQLKTVRFHPKRGHFKKYYRVKMSCIVNCWNHEHPVHIRCWYRLVYPLNILILDIGSFLLSHTHF